jgi:hypothetical protein
LSSDDDYVTPSDRKEEDGESKTLAEMKAAKSANPKKR